MKVDVLDADPEKYSERRRHSGCSRHRHRSALHGFHHNGGNATVSVFDTNTFKTIKTNHRRQRSRFRFLRSATKRVLVCHGDAAAITAIDPEKQEVTGKIDLGGGAEAAVVDGKGTGFVNLEESAVVCSFDRRASE